MDKIYWCSKDPYESKYKFLIFKQERKGSKHFNHSKDFIEYSNNMNNIYKKLKNKTQIKNIKC